MPSGKKEKQSYRGFEQGPIRPPSEADSLLIRVTRNCPWNFCTFCPVYKSRRFSLRPVAHVIRDIDAVHKYVTMLKENTGGTGRISMATVRELSPKVSSDETGAFQAALHWFSGGLASVFLQDANSLIIKPQHLVEILLHLKRRFPWIERITSYARSQTVARISDADLSAIRQAGLNRIHIGLESGSDKVLKSVRKGTTKEMHISAGIKTRKAGMELSEYVMPGLGGRTLSREHAVETADALNRINPDFIRLRTLALPEHIPLFEEHRTGAFEKCTDLETAAEILTFIQHLDGITSTLKSDHVLNLFQEIEGVLPGDKARLTSFLQDFLDLPPERQTRYMVGRRLGIFRRLDDMTSPYRMQKVESICQKNEITPQNVDEIVGKLMKRFI
ncbi:radical SAM protein [Desulfococcus sp.]|uniref:radical SAM protein n=1 Tax=Desulfococcus sp. TaxID=2025834 RepID=UPI003D0AFAFC